MGLADNVWIEEWLLSFCCWVHPNSRGCGELHFAHSFASNFHARAHSSEALSSLRPSRVTDGGSVHNKNVCLQTVEKPQD